MSWPSPVMRSPTALPKANSNSLYEIDVAGTKEWVNTNIDVHGGAKLRFTATGKTPSRRTHPTTEDRERWARLVRMVWPVDLPT